MVIIWLFTDRGFVSLVKYDPTHRKYGKAAQPARAAVPAEPMILVRARVKGDIEAVFPGAKVEEKPGSDYLYRSVVTQAEAAVAIAARVSQIDYNSHFKDIAIRRSGPVQSGSRSTAYYAVWNAMADLQPIAPYGTQWNPVRPSRGSYTGSFGGAVKTTPAKTAQPSALATWYKDQEDHKTIEAPAPGFDWTAYDEAEPNIWDDGNAPVDTDDIDVEIEAVEDDLDDDQLAMMTESEIQEYVNRKLTQSPSDYALAEVKITETLKRRPRRRGKRGGKKNR